MGLLALVSAGYRSRPRRPDRKILEARIERIEQMLARLDPPEQALAPLIPTAGAIDLKPSDTDPASTPLCQSIYALADRGHEPADIARQLDEQIGKVELVLALRQVRPQT